MFQSLTGRLKTGAHCKGHNADSMFQSLTGRLKTSPLAGAIVIEVSFNPSQVG